MLVAVGWSTGRTTFTFCQNVATGRLWRVILHIFWSTEPKWNYPSEIKHGLSNHHCNTFTILIFFPKIANVHLRIIFYSTVHLARAHWWFSIVFDECSLISSAYFFILRPSGMLEFSRFSMMIWQKKIQKILSQYIEKFGRIHACVWPPEGL